MREKHGYGHSLTLGFQGPHCWVLTGSRALTIRSLEAYRIRLFVTKKEPWRAEMPKNKICVQVSGVPAKLAVMFGIQLSKAATNQT